MTSLVPMGTRNDVAADFGHVEEFSSDDSFDEIDYLTLLDV